MRDDLVAALLLIAFACAAGGTLDVYDGRLSCLLLFIPAAAAVFGAMVCDYNARWSL